VLSAGTRLGPYEVIAPLGKGGMGVVYRARDPRLGRDVAIKLIAGAHADDPGTREQFFTEMRAVAALAHPNILNIFDIGEDAGVRYAVMELVTGYTLLDALKAGRLPSDLALDIASQIAAALSAAHARGVIHLDLKPANVMVLDDGRVKLLDFGLARMDQQPEPDQGVTRIGGANVVAGTPGYFSPEQARGLAIDHRSDLFSFGVVLYELMTGRRAFPSSSFGDGIAMAVSEEPPEAKMPAEIAAIVRRCLAKRPSDRYASADEIVAALADARNLSGRPAPMAAPRGPSVAVLPFADMSEAHDQEYFCDGMAEELISALSKIDGLAVASRTSAFRFRGASVDLKQVADALNVSAVLEGGVRRSGAQMRITVRLTQVADGFQLWSERFDRDASDIFAVQDEIARTVVDALRGTLSSPVSTLVRRMTDDLDAYSLYLQGRFHWNRRTTAEVRVALDFFEKAIARDPAFAQAYVGAADAWLMLALYGGAPVAEAMERARASAEGALLLLPGLAEAEATLGSIHGLHDWDWSAAAERFGRAIDHAPGYSTAHQWRAMHEYLPLGQFDEAEASLRKALALDPLSMPVKASLGLVLHYAGKDDEAMSVLQAAIASDPTFTLTHVFLGHLLLDQGRAIAAYEAFDTARRLSPSDPQPLAGLIVAQTRMDNLVAAETLAQQLGAMDQAAPVSLVLKGLVRDAFGDIDGALRIFEQAFDERVPDLTWAAVRPSFERLRREPRFRDILSRMHLEHVQARA
jgi:serine/threonine-protein kinase